MEGSHKGISSPSAIVVSAMYGLRCCPLITNSPPLGLHLPREQLQPGVENQDLIIRFEASANDPLVMICLDFFLLDFCALISQVPDLFELVNLDGPPLLG